MRGAIAAGSRQAAEAGAWALREGGTAVDAAIAAVFAAFVSEGPLTGPAGGGFVLLREADGTISSLDCFFAVPTAARRPMDEVVIDFGDASTQVFHVGDGSVAVPGLVAGLHAAHARAARLPWAKLLEPALELARTGIETTPEQAFLVEILVGILQREKGGRQLYGTPGLVRTDVLVPTLDLIAAQGPRRGAGAPPRPRRRSRAIRGRRASADHARLRRDDASSQRPFPPSAGASSRRRSRSSSDRAVARSAPSRMRSRRPPHSRTATHRLPLPVPSRRERRTSRSSMPTAQLRRSRPPSAPARGSSATASSSTTCWASSTSSVTSPESPGHGCRA